MGPDSSLDWEKEQRLAHNTPDFLWEFDWGPFDPLHLMTYHIAIQHFTKTLYPHFPSANVLLYRGPVLPPDTLLELLSALPEEVTPYLAFRDDLSQIFHFISHEGAEHFRLLDFPYTEAHSTALLLPAHSWEGFHWQKLPPPFRVIPEHRLTEEWGGVERLIVFTACLSLQGLRKLHGYVASQGHLLTIGPPLNLSGEENWHSLAAQGSD